MKERGMIFNAEMVRALLDGGKTQTRRPIKSDHIVEGGEVYKSAPFNRKYIGGLVSVRCPFGEPGDRIWVRETFGMEVRSLGGTPHEQLVYRADKPDAVRCYDCNGRETPMKWKPSIHMPRWASRITLEITNIRVERVQDISEDDALTEGVYQGESTGGCPNYWHSHTGEKFATARNAFQYLWQSIYGNWDANPWVWVIEFKRIDNQQVAA